MSRGNEGFSLRSQRVFDAISDPSRRRILRLVADRELPIAAIAKEFSIGRTAVNKHLHVLQEAGLVQNRRVGRETRYTLRPEPLMEVEGWLAFFEPYWTDKLKALAEFVEGEDL